MIAFFGCGGSSDPVAPQAENPAGLSSEAPGMSAGLDENRSAQIVWTLHDETSTEPNDTNELAVPADHGMIFSGNVNEVFDPKDMFKVELPYNDGAIYARLTWAPGATIILGLSNQYIGIIDTVSSSGGTLEIFADGLLHGDHYLDVLCVTGQANYTLKIAVAYEYLEPDNDFKTTTPWEFGPGLSPQWIYDTSTDILRSAVVQYNDTLGSYDNIKLDVAQGEEIVATLDFVLTEGAWLTMRIWKVDGNSSTPVSMIHTGVAPLTIDTDPLDAGTYAIEIYIYGGYAIYELEAEKKMLAPRPDDRLRNYRLIPEFIIPGPGPVIRDNPVDLFDNRIYDFELPAFEQPLGSLGNEAPDMSNFNIPQIGN